MRTAGFLLIGFLAGTLVLLAIRFKSTVDDLAAAGLPIPVLIEQIEACRKMGGYPLFDTNGRREATAVPCRVLVGD